MRWLELSPEMGSALWSAYRKELRTGGAVAVYSTLSDPRGQWGQPRMEAEIGTTGGGCYLLRLVTTFDVDVMVVDGYDYAVRKNEETRYYLPLGDDND